MPPLTAAGPLSVWQIVALLLTALGVGKFLQVLLTTRGAIWIKKEDELAAVRKSLQEQLAAQEARFDRKLSEQEVRHTKEMDAAAAERKEEQAKWEKTQEAHKADLEAMAAKVEKLSRDLWEEQHGRRTFEDKVLLIIRYQWTDKRAVNDLASEIEARRHGDKAAPKTKLRVLAVDDEADLLLLLKTALSTEGYEVATARSGAEALQQFVMAKDLGRPFSLVLLDFNMPFMAGDEVARELRARDQSVPILFLTAMDDNSFPSALLDEVDAVKATKPIELPKLLEKVAAVVG